ncbi:hypothetical protein LINPERHAP1_LOCUS21721 [Linum perenne]
MAVTAHYIDNGWCLRSQLLRFIYVPAPHTADRRRRFLVDCLMEWNVDTKEDLNLKFVLDQLRTTILMTLTDFRKKGFTRMRTRRAVS